MELQVRLLLVLWSHGQQAKSLHHIYSSAGNVLSWRTFSRSCIHNSVCLGKMYFKLIYLSPFSVWCANWCLIHIKWCGTKYLIVIGTINLIGVCRTPMWSTGLFSEIKNLHRLNRNELKVSCLQDVRLWRHIHGKGCLQTPMGFFPIRLLGY